MSSRKLNENESNGPEVHDEFLSIHHFSEPAEALCKVSFKPLPDMSKLILPIKLINQCIFCTLGTKNFQRSRYSKKENWSLGKAKKFFN